MHTIIILVRANRTQTRFIMAMKENSYKEKKRKSTVLHFMHQNHITDSRKLLLNIKQTNTFFLTKSLKANKKKPGQEGTGYIKIRL